ncbi:MAG: DNA-directed RNA polymerase subunit alpha C-terminal domain-containing protein [Candidatus Wallbacteria bacterium]|nr:DNA-directed RNA polymerase subunit alpha C-terminal domain-containing protein [Candidatus Wallbacteria bacterium]
MDLLKQKMTLIKPKVTFIPHESNPLAGRFEVEPLEKGVGITIGALIEGFLLKLFKSHRPCAFCFKHHNVNDFFSEIPGIKENCEEIITNLKKVNAVIPGDLSEVIAKIKLAEGEITAGHLAGDGLQVTNPAQHLFTVTKKISSTFEVLFANKSGYYFVDDFRHDPDFHEELTYFDTTFTPVQTILHQIDNARVGRSINYDKLMLEMTVFEGFSPRDLYQNTIQTLQDLFFRITEVIPEEVSEFSVEKIETEKGDNNLAISINDLELSIRCRNCLKQISIKTLGDLTEKTVDELMEIKNFGKKSLDELREILFRYNLKFKGET